MILKMIDMEEKNENVRQLLDYIENNADFLRENPEESKERLKLILKWTRAIQTKLGLDTDEEEDEEERCEKCGQIIK